MDKVKLSKIKKILAKNLGEVTAEMYINFYKNKDDETITTSFSALLVEFFGPENAKKELNLIK